jgi:hypothetical protein
MIKHAEDVLENFEAKGLTTQIFTMDWFYTLFGRNFKLEVVRIVWDIFLIFGSYHLLRIGLSVLTILREDILNTSMQDGSGFVRKNTKTLEISQILKNVFADEKFITDKQFFKKVCEAQLELEQFDLDVEFFEVMRKI